MATFPSTPLPSPALPDGELLAALCQGDTRAFDQLVERYQVRLMHFIERFTRDHALAEDLLQQVWLQLYISRNTLSPQGSLWPWLVKVARNRCIDERRRQEHHPLLVFSRLYQLEQQGAENMLLELPDPALTPEEYVEQCETRQATIESSLSVFPPRVREVVLLRILGEWSYRDIGQQLHISEATARRRFHRAKQRLRASQQQDS